MIFLWYYPFPQILSSFAYDILTFVSIFQPFFLHFPKIFPWFSCIFPRIFPWFSRIFLGCSHHFPAFSQDFPMIFPHFHMISQGLPHISTPSYPQARLRRHLRRALAAPCAASDDVAWRFVMGRVPLGKPRRRAVEELMRRDGMGWDEFSIITI